jgi:hypothetical protein
MKRTIVSALLVLVSVAYASAQTPVKVWEHEFVNTSHPLQYDEGSGILVVSFHHDIISLDTRTYTEIGRFTPTGHVRPPYLAINDSLVADYIQNPFRTFNVRTGEEVAVAPQVKYSYRDVDHNSLGALYLDRRNDTAMYVIADLGSQQEVFSFTWTPYALIHASAIDVDRQLLYGRIDSVFVRVDRDGRIDTIVSSTLRNAYGLKSGLVLDNGDVLVVSDRVGEDNGTSWLYRLSGQTLRFTDSVELGTSHAYGWLMLPMENGVVVKAESAPDWWVAPSDLSRTKPIILKGLDDYSLYRTPGSHLIAFSHGNHYVVQDDLASVSKIWSDRWEVSDVAQISDGRVAISTSFTPLQFLDPRTGERQSPRWSRGQVIADRRIERIIPSRQGPWVSLNNTIVSLDDSTVKCTVKGFYQTAGQWTWRADPEIEWIDSDGETSIASFTTEYYGAGSVGFHVLPAPCKDTTLHYTDGPYSYDESGPYDHWERPRLAVADDGRSLCMGLLGFRNGIFDEHIFVFPDAQAIPADPENYWVIDSSHYAVYTSVSGMCVSDHKNGLQRFRPAVESSTELLSYGRRLLPLSSYHQQPVIVVADTTDATLRAINVETGAEQWTIEIGYMPHKVVVSRDDRWLLLLDKGRSLSMYTIDTTVSVAHERVQEPAVVVYPNPASDNVTIEMQVSGQTTVTIVDPLGQTVYTTQSTGRTTFSTAGWPSGGYTAILSDKDRTLVRRFLVIH